MDSEADIDVERVDIAPQGDLVLIVGATLELRVHSFVMRLHAPDFFNALLGPNFAEGQTQGSAAEPKRINLPEDGAKGMKFLCCILHLRNDLMLSPPSGPEFNELAVAAEKYNCIDPIRTYLGNWIDSIKLVARRDAASYLSGLCVLDDARRFSEMTKQLILHVPGMKWLPNRFADDPKNSDLQSIKGAVISHARAIYGKVEAAINDAVNPLVTSLASEYDHYVNEMPFEEQKDYMQLSQPGYDSDEDMDDKSNKKVCDYLHRYVVLQLKALTDANIYPVSAHSLSLQMLQITVANFEIAEDRSIKRCWSEWGQPCNVDRTDNFWPDIRKMQRTIGSIDCSLCLDCVKAGGWNDGKCRVHPNKEKAAEY
ncbi:hypothetical protein HII31_01211 [Pseudocercospora fuligena]|uniref:BTB domain-containing protein n=1 Tax=Pseudocercospora fuligena TaxID=685502 RepID=A0A8H6RS32_9PEZI|nr:hypothetical protein HII31_01211 [Pseudocercospora fuligena]